ncbi:MAG: hypothetical protein CRN43_02730 [Candidatus Nephrothrix sp. EaCA]|nr:MAG: hypothetical protein CRN43_02730 [Candidatus Nephrothrix sp. EaCA]
MKVLGHEGNQALRVHLMFFLDNAFKLKIRYSLPLRLPPFENMGAINPDKKPARERAARGRCKPRSMGVNSPVFKWGRGQRKF